MPCASRMACTSSGAAALGNADYGVYIQDGAQGNMIGGNTISANDYGLWLQGVNTSQNLIIANAIGIAGDGASPMGNTHNGIHISIAAQSNNIIGNQIAYNGGNGVGVDTPTAFDNLIWMNSIHNNDEMGIDLTNGANHGMLPPNIHTTALGAGTVIVSGAACPNCRVELYTSPNTDGEGQVFLGLAMAGPAGDFDIEVSALPYPYLTATATGTGNGTSEFSAVFTSTVYFIFLPLVMR